MTIRCALATVFVDSEDVDFFIAHLKTVTMKLKQLGTDYRFKSPGKHICLHPKDRNPLRKSFCGRTDEWYGTIYLLSERKICL